MKTDFLSFLSNQGTTREEIEGRLGQPLSTDSQGDGSVQVQYALDLDAHDLSSINVSHSEDPASAPHFAIITYNAQGRRVSHLIQ